MAALVSNSQRYIARNKSQAYCLEDANFHYDSFCCLRTVEASSVGLKAFHGKNFCLGQTVQHCGSFYSIFFLI